MGRIDLRKNLGKAAGRLFQCLLIARLGVVLVDRGVIGREVGRDAPQGLELGQVPLEMRGDRVQRPVELRQDRLGRGASPVELGLQAALVGNELLVDARQRIGPPAGGARQVDEVHAVLAAKAGIGTLGVALENVTDALPWLEGDLGPAAVHKVKGHECEAPRVRFDAREDAHARPVDISLHVRKMELVKGVHLAGVVVVSGRGRVRRRVGADCLDLNPDWEEIPRVVACLFANLDLAAASSVGQVVAGEGEDERRRQRQVLGEAFEGAGGDLKLVGIVRDGLEGSLDEVFVYEARANWLRSCSPCFVLLIRGYGKGGQ